MAFYRGTSTKGQIFDLIIQKLTTTPTGASSPYWKAINSAPSEGVILHSKGKSGTDDIYLRFRPHNAGSHTDSRFYVTMMEDYQPNSIQGIEGTVENESSVCHFAYADTNVSYQEGFPVHYLLSFDRDKIMLVLEGDPAVHSNKNDNYATLLWVGMPHRLSKENDSTAVTMAVSRWGGYITPGYNTSSAYQSISITLDLRNRRRDPQGRSYMRTISGQRSKGWGDHILLSKLYLEDVDYPEGVRSVMENVHPIFQPSNADFNHGDEITVGSRRYVVMEVGGHYTNANMFPSYWMAIEQLL